MPRAESAFAPYLEFTPYSLADVVESVRARFFPRLRGPIPVFVVEASAVAWVVRRPSEGVRGVYFHPLLNHPDTPIEVIDNIARHELLHMDRTGVRDIFYPGGHSPEFWAAEREISPDMPLVSEWVISNFAPVLRQAREGFYVTRGWKRFELTARTPFYALPEDAGSTGGNSPSSFGVWSAMLVA